LVLYYSYLKLNYFIVGIYYMYILLQIHNQEDFFLSNLIEGAGLMRPRFVTIFSQMRHLGRSNGSLIACVALISRFVDLLVVMGVVLILRVFVEKLIPVFEDTLLAGAPVFV